MKTLFVIGAPRTGTTQIARWCFELTLCASVPGTHWETLNPGCVGWPVLRAWDNYSAVAWSEAEADTQNALLTEAVFRFGEAGLLVKDVLWPRVVFDFARKGEHPVLVVLREPAMMAHCLRRVGWKHPVKPYGLTETWPNVARACAHLQTILLPGFLGYHRAAAVCVDDIGQSPELLPAALRKLGLSVREWPYLKDRHRAKARTVQAYRETDNYEQITRWVEESRAEELQFNPKKHMG